MKKIYIKDLLSPAQKLSLSQLPDIYPLGQICAIEENFQKHCYIHYDRSHGLCDGFETPSVMIEKPLEFILAALHTQNHSFVMGYTHSDGPPRRIAINIDHITAADLYTDCRSIIAIETGRCSYHVHCNDEILNILKDSHTEIAHECPRFGPAFR